MSCLIYDCFPVFRSKAKHSIVLDINTEGHVSNAFDYTLTHDANTDTHTGCAVRVRSLSNREGCVGQV